MLDSVVSAAGLSDRFAITPGANRVTWNRRASAPPRRFVAPRRLAQRWPSRYTIGDREFCRRVMSHGS